MCERHVDKVVAVQQTVAVGIVKSVEKAVDTSKGGRKKKGKK